MVTVQQDPQDGWLQNDNTVLISALAAITVATSSVLLWRCQKFILLQETAHTPAPSTLRTAFTSLRVSSFSSPVIKDVYMEAVPEQASHDVAQQGGEEGAKGKVSRSKERRRRGKGPFKEFSKGGKRHKELLRQLNRPSVVSTEESTIATSEQSCPRQDERPLQTDESPSVQISASSRPDEFAPNQLSAVYNRPMPPTAKSPGENPLLTEEFHATASSIEGREDKCSPLQPTRVMPPDTSLASLDASSQASLDHFSASASSCGSSSLTEASCSPLNTPSRKSQKRTHTRTASCSWDRDGQSSFYHDLPPRFAGARATNTQRGSNSPIYSPVTFSLPDTPFSLSGISSSSSFIQPPTPCDDATSPTPASRGGSRHPSIPHLPLTPPPISVSTQTQIASLRGALEAARLREEKSRVEAERRAKDYDALSWRWAEERTRWHRREAELHAQIQHLTLALQMYAGSPTFAPTTVPIFPAFASSPLSCEAPSTMTRRFSNPALDNTRGRRRKRVQDDGEGNGDSDDMFPCNDRVAGAILKRPENLRAGTRRSCTPPNDSGPLRFPSLSDLGNVWPARDGEAESPSKRFGYGASVEVGEGGKDTEGATGTENDKTCVEKMFERTFERMDNTRDKIPNEKLA